MTITSVPAPGLRAQLIAALAESPLDNGSQFDIEIAADQLLEVIAEATRPTRVQIQSLAEDCYAAVHDLPRESLDSRDRAAAAHRLTSVLIARVGAVR